MYSVLLCARGADGHLQPSTMHLGALGIVWIDIGGVQVVLQHATRYGRLDSHDEKEDWIKKMHFLSKYLIDYG